MEEPNIQDIEDILRSQHVIDMLTLSNEYALFMEACADYNTREIIDYLRRVIPMLYLKGSLIPAVEAADDYITEKYVSEEHWENVYNTLKERFDLIPADQWPAGELRSGELAELLADVYQDLKDFVVLFQKALTVEKQNALADLGTSYQPFWGQRLAEMLPLLHTLHGAEFAEGGKPGAWDSLWDE